MKLIHLKIKDRPLLLFALLFGVATALGACSELDKGIAKVNAGADGLAVHGFDTVAFFAENSAIRGNPTYEFVWNGARWLFANAENLEKFKSSPEAYAPQFGGYCSYAVSHGYTADGDPETWKIVDGKLYLNYNRKAKEAWEADQENFIKNGQENWAKFLKKKPEHKE